MQDESASAREITRAGGATTTASLTAFSMNYENNKYNFKKGGSGWSPTTTSPWPVPDNTPIDFYAYNGGSFVWTENNPHVAFTAEENAGDLKDFLVAKHENISYNDNSGIVSLTFDHACAAVQFYVYKEESATYSVSDIKLSNVIKSGDYYYNNAENARWVLGGTTTYYTLTTTSIYDLSTTPQRLPCGWLYLIPQSKSDITIDVTYSKNGGASTTKPLTLSGTWEAGKQYTVNIRIGGKAS
jgi:hypothetical protein